MTVWVATSNKDYHLGLTSLECSGLSCLSFLMPTFPLECSFQSDKNITHPSRPISEAAFSLKLTQHHGSSFFLDRINPLFPWGLPKTLHCVDSALYTVIEPAVKLCPPCQVSISARAENIKRLKVVTPLPHCRGTIHSRRENLEKLKKIK